MQNKEFKPISIQYDFGSVNGFESVYIGMDESKYLICYRFKHGLGSEVLFELKDIIIGGLGFLANKKNINKTCKFFDTYEECIEVLSNRNVENLISDLKKFRKKDCNFLLAVK